MNRVALVVGAAGGVGLEMVKQLRAAKYEVVGTVLNRSEAAQVEAAVGPLKDIIELDLADADNVALALRARLDRLDAVVLCAAISPYSPLEIVPLSQLRKTLEINTISAVAVYQACIPLLRAAKGRIVLVSSFAGKMAVPIVGSYVASKFALEGLADVMRRESRPHGVEVIVIEPGSIKTAMLTGQIATIGKDQQALPADQAALYGHLYRSFAGLLKMGMETGLEPAAVAAHIVEVLQSDAPLTRYQLGEDAQYLCNVAAKQPDFEQDAIVAGLMAQGG